MLCAFRVVFYALSRNIMLTDSLSLTGHDQFLILFGFVFYLQGPDFLLEPVTFFNTQFILHVNYWAYAHLYSVSSSFLI